VKLLFSSKIAQQEMRTDPGAKFIMFARSGDQDDIIVKIFEIEKTHFTQWKHNLKEHPADEFLGAGFITSDVPRWGSESCEGHIGFDQPMDSDQEQKYLALIAKLIRDSR